MKNSFKQIKKYVIFTAIISFFTFLVFEGQRRSLTNPHNSSLNEYAKVTESHSVSNKRAIKRSRHSSVRIISFDFHSGMMATSSATYFTHNERFYILTTSHGLMGDCHSIQIEAAGELFSCLDIVANNELEDYAILEVEEVYNRNPINFPKHFMRGRLNWNKTLTLTNQTIYTGYPNSIGPLTVGGTIMGFSPQGLIYIQSYAWSGSSGSGIFDQSGKLFGYILAIDVGQTEFGAAVLENVMIVVPIYKIDWSVIFNKE
tara:strand:+ start:843 stop:1619 length:777 start_codon:yes stop_codon:yes gene_type:complete